MRLSFILKFPPCCTHFYYMNVLYNSDEIRSPTWTFSYLFEYVLTGSCLLYIPPKHFGSSGISYFVGLIFLSPPTRSKLADSSTWWSSSYFFLEFSLDSFDYIHYIALAILIVATNSIVSWRACLQRLDSLLNSNLELLVLSSTLFWTRFDWTLWTAVSTKLFTLPPCLCDMGVTRPWLTSQIIG